MPRETKVLEKPIKPVKPGSSKPEKPGKTQKSDTVEKSSKSEKSVEKSYNREISFREKYASANKEERSLLRKEKREWKAAKKAAKDESSKNEDTEPSAPIDFNADLSNRNNITINNTGLEKIAEVIGDL